MKWINRIIFGLVVAIGLMLVASITDEYYRSREILKLTKEHLENEAYEKFISAAYYHQTPVYEENIEIEDNSYLVLVYNAAHIKQTQTDHQVSEGFQVLVIQKTGIALPEYFDVDISFGEETLSYAGFNLYNQNIYTFYNQDNNKTLIYEDDLIINDVFYNINNISFIKDGNTLFDLDITLDQSMLNLKSDLSNYILENGTKPTENLNDIIYANPVIINTKNEVIRNVLIYLVIVIVSYVLLFVKKRKNLGVKQATEGLKKDIEQLKAKKSDE